MNYETKQTHNEIIRWSKNGMLKTVCLTGWQPGCQKIVAIKFIMESTKMNLGDSKRTVDFVLNGMKAVYIRVGDERAEWFVRHLNIIGIKSEIVK